MEWELFKNSYRIFGFRCVDFRINSKIEKRCSITRWEFSILSIWKPMYYWVKKCNFFVIWKWKILSNMTTTVRTLSYRILLELQFWLCRRIQLYIPEFFYDYYINSYQNLFNLPHRICSFLRLSHSSWNIFYFGCLCCWLMCLFWIIHCLKHFEVCIVENSRVVVSFWGFSELDIFGIRLILVLDYFTVIFVTNSWSLLEKYAIYSLPNFILKIDRCLSLYQQFWSFFLFSYHGHRRRCCSFRFFAYWRYALHDVSYDLLSFDF